MILVRKDGFWEETDNGFEKPKNILACLRKQVELEDVTLLNVFNAVEEYPRLLAFIAQYSWCDAIEEFHAQARELHEISKEDPLTHLEIYWHVQNHKKSFRLHPGFHGRNNETPYSVSYTPMYELSQLPIKIDTSFKVCTSEIKPKVIFEGNQEFTLLEFLDAIYDDISFIGGPQDNANFIEEMKERLERISSGQEKLTEIEDWRDLLGFDDNDEEGVDS